MDMKKLIVKFLEKKGRVATADLVNKTGLSRAYAQRFLKELADEGVILRIGKANQAHYVLPSEKGILLPPRARKVLLNKGLSEDKVLDAVKRESDESFQFSKTGVRVKLYHQGIEYVSRSQARRIVAGLEKFKIIELDFEGVETVGQAFADEIFRVWQNAHKEIKVLIKNTNENILFMIRRAQHQLTTG